MNHEALGRSHFPQLYFQAARIRTNELSEFFSRFEEGPDSGMTPAKLEAAAERAAEIHEFLQRLTAYMNEAAHLGEAPVQRQVDAPDAAARHLVGPDPSSLTD